MVHTEQHDSMARSEVVDAQLPKGTDERFSGHGAMGVPFASGHYLTLRQMTASSVGPGYTAVWHRDPHGEWTIYTNVPPDVSCPRYFSAATHTDAVVGPVEMSWTGTRSIEVAIPNVLDWHIEFATTGATRLMSAAAGMMPESAWRSEIILRAMGRVAGPVLGAGRIRLRGHVPNRQRFQMAPRTVWVVTESAAVMYGKDLGRPGPLPEQEHLVDFWMPQRGLFVTGTIRFENFDSVRHLPPVPAVAKER